VGLRQARSRHENVVVVTIMAKRLLKLVKKDKKRDAEGGKDFANRERRHDRDGKYLEVDPPRLLSYTWVATWTGSAKTRVR